jgi:hypothetical protein
MSVAWRKALRFIWQVPYMTHCNVITVLSESAPLEICLAQRFCKFASAIYEKGSDIVKALTNPFSTFCFNVCEMSGNCNGPLSDFTIDDFKSFRSLLHNNWSNSVNEMSQDIEVLREMIDIRDGFKECDVLTIDEVKDIIDDICLN